MPVQARAVYIKKEAHEAPRSMARIRRMLPFVKCATPPRVIDDAAWHQLVIDEKLNELPRHGRRGMQIEPVVIFNQFLYRHDAAERARREKLYPELFQSASLRYAGYDGWYWRRSGDEEDRKSTGLVCQPAYAIHSFWGCHFRCAYCNLGHVANIYVNLEDWIEHIRERLSAR